MSVNDTTIEGISRDSAQKLVAANGVRRLIAKQVGNGYLLLLDTQNANYALNIARRKEPRVYKSLDTLSVAVMDLGARYFDVEMMGSRPSRNRSLF